MDKKQAATIFILPRQLADLTKWVEQQENKWASISEAKRILALPIKKKD
jgi:hypothetical protein